MMAMVGRRLLGRNEHWTPFRARGPGPTSQGSPPRAAQRGARKNGGVEPPPRRRVGPGTRGSGIQADASGGQDRAPSRSQRSLRVRRGTCLKRVGGRRDRTAQTNAGTRSEGRSGAIPYKSRDHSRASTGRASLSLPASIRSPVPTSRISRCRSGTISVGHGDSEGMANTAHWRSPVATGPHAPQGALGRGPGRSLESRLLQHQRASPTTDEPRSPPNRPMGTAPPAGWGRNLMNGPDTVGHSSWHVSQDGSQPRPDDTGARA
jgi:hypothetical protein